MHRVIGLLICTELLFSVNGQGYNSRRCSLDRMRSCKDTIVRSIEKRINDMNRQEMMQHCDVVRSDFNCLLTETRCMKSEAERRNNADILRKGLVYIRDGCDTYGGGWKQSSCFVGDGMKNCEDSHPLSSGQYSSYDVETCRKYNLFQECVMHVLKNRCAPEDDVLVGQYLLARAQDLSWNCGDTDSDRTRDRGRDRDRDWDRERDNGRYGGSDGRSGYDRSRDRNQGQWRSQSDYGSDRYSDRDRYGSGRYSGGYSTSDRYNTSNARDHHTAPGLGDITCCRNEYCDRTRMNQCRSSLTRTVDNRNGGYQDEAKCRKARDDFNCLLWQTTCLQREDRDRDNDIFHRARDFLSRYCDTFSRWTENSCYKSSEMQQCETRLSPSRGGASYESCRAYNDFRQCMEDELRSRCTREDDLLQGAYLVDKAQEMSWQCANDNANTGMRSGGYNAYNDRNDRYDRRYPSSYDDRQYEAYENTQHLSDDEAMCQSRMQSSADSCRNEMNRKRQQPLDNQYEYDNQKRQCCTAYAYKRCLLDATRRVCMQEKYRVADSFLGKERYEINGRCRSYTYDQDCNSGHAVQVSSLLLLFISSLLLLHR